MRTARRLLAPRREYDVTFTNQDTKVTGSLRHVSGTPPHVGQKLTVRYVDGEVVRAIVMSGGRENGVARFVVNSMQRLTVGQHLDVIGVRSA